MAVVPNNAVEVDSISESHVRYSICTLMSNPEEYSEMVQSFQEAGFDNTFCEYLYIDNSKTNKYDAYKGLNKFLSLAKGKYIILCHQDILLNYDNLEVLEKRIEEMNKLDESWAVLGNAGAVGIKHIVLRITEPNGVLHKAGNPPKKVLSLDENFLIVKKKSNLGVSVDLNGFHLYGTDICLQSIARGFSAYVINFNLLHKSKGNADEKFFQLKKDFIAKYLDAWKGRYIQTTITKFYISGSPFLNLFFNSRLLMFLSRKYYKRKFKKETIIID